MSAQSMKPGWKMVKFGDVVKNANLVERDLEASGIERIVGLEHLDPENLHVRRWNSPENGTSFSRKFVSGQTLFGKRRAYQRKVAFAEFEGVCSGDILTFEPKDKKVLLPELLPFICQSDAFFDHAMGTSAGSLSPRTSWKALKGFEFSLPPIETQRRIAEILWAADETVEKFYQTIKGIEAFRSSAEQAIWRQEKNRTTIGELIKSGPKNGLYVPATKYGTGIPILRIDSFYQGQVKSDVEFKRVSIDKKTKENFLLQENDIVINRVNSREYLGKSAIIPYFPEPTVFESNMMCFSVDEKAMLPHFLIAMLNSPQVRNQILSCCKDAINQSSINQQDVKGIIVPNPSKTEQKQVVAINRSVHKKYWRYVTI